MKKRVIMVCLMIASFGITSAFGADRDKDSRKDENNISTEKKLTDEELESLKARVVEIRDMDKSELSTSEKRELRSELKEIKEAVKADGGYIYIGVGTLLVAILLLLLLL